MPDKNILIVAWFNVCVFFREIVFDETKLFHRGYWLNFIDFTIVLSHNDFPPSAEQPDQRILAHKL